ncbi:lipoprotein [Paraclostridium ghonii]|uniref:Lipoprotein n=1 Tax=Paraclostridium ghonii TaxID=29358 RepID=A0ABU0N1L4_9FIRM|nr:hypothetical protein [Paeniclostridium ghonii]MDQ0557058.1 hypothetical protein [Paeniclostridium ghonii]
MKLFKLIVLVLLAGFFNVGCTSTESPEQLIEKPIYNEQKQKLKDNIENSLKGSKPLLPKNSSDVSVINEVDLDKNGTKELIVFQKKEDINENNSNVGFSIMNYGKDSVYSVIDEYLIKGESIEYANFYDLDNDGNKEIILLTKNGNKTNLDICQFKNDKITRLYRLDQSWIKDSDGYTDIKVYIGNLDDDGIQDIIIYSLNPETHKMIVSLTYFDEYIRLKDYTTIDDVKSLDNVYVDIKKVRKDKKGIIVGYKSFAGNDSYITQILYLRENKLLKAFNEDDIRTRNKYYMPPENIDKDKDGVVEIPIINDNTGSNNKKASANVSWYSWNGKENEQSNLVFVSQIYYNYENNFKFLIPNNLANKIYIEEEQNKFDFMYYDAQNSERINLFTISKATKNNIDESKRVNPNNKNAGYMILETEKETYTLLVDNPDILKKLNITNETIKEWFSPIY